MATRPIVDKAAAPPLAVSDRLQLAEELLDLAERAQAHARAAGSAIALKLGEKLYVRTSSGVAPEVGSSLLMGEGAIGQCARLGKPCNVSEEDKIDASLRALGVRSLIAVPIHHAGIFYGVLVVLAQTPEAFTRMQVAIMMTMGNEVARVLKRMEPAAMEIAPGAPLRNAAPPTAIPDDNVIEIQLTPTARQDIVETLKNIEQKPAASVKPRTEAVPAAKMAPAPKPSPAAAPVLTPVQVAAMSAPVLDAAPAAPKPLPDLLPPGEDPRRYGTLKTAKPLQTPAFVTANAFVQPRPSSRMRMPAIAAAVLVTAGIGFAMWRHNGTTPAPKQVAAASEAAVAAPAAAPMSAVAVAPAKPEPVVPAPVPVKAEMPKKAVEEKAVEKTMASAVEEPLHIAAPVKHADFVPAEAPSLTLASSSALPDLGTPKVPAAKLLVKQAVVTPPAALVQVKPIYPEIARRSGAFGNVRLQVTISPAGKVAHVRVLEGPAVLQAAAVSAVNQWQYRPATLDGRAVESTLQVLVKFAQP